jgi:hypothetical protein
MNGMEMRRHAIGMRTALRTYPAADDPHGFADAVAACEKAEADAAKQLKADAAKAAREAKK